MIVEMDYYSDDKGNDDGDKSNDDGDDDLFMSIRLDYIPSGSSLSCSSLSCSSLSCSSLSCSSSSMDSLEEFNQKEIENPFIYGCRILGAYLYEQMKIEMEDKIHLEINQIMEEIIDKIVEQNMFTISKNLPWDEEYNFDKKRDKREKRDKKNKITE